MRKSQLAFHRTSFHLVTRNKGTLVTQVMEQNTNIGDDYNLLNRFLRKELQNVDFRENCIIVYCAWERSGLEVQYRLV